MRSPLFPAVTVLIGFFSFGAIDRASLPEAGTAAIRLSPEDQKFVLNSVQREVIEIDLSKLAGQKGKREDVRKLGKTLILDHSRVIEELEHLFRKKGVVIPPELNGPYLAALDHFSKLKGEEFDKAYLAEMVAAHQKSVAEFESKAKDAKDPNLRAFVNKSIPILRADFDRVHNVQRGIGVGTD